MMMKSLAMMRIITKMFPQCNNVSDARFPIGMISIMTNIGIPPKKMDWQKLKYFQTVAAYSRLYETPEDLVSDNTFSWNGFWQNHFQMLFFFKYSMGFVITLCDIYVWYVICMIYALCRTFGRQESLKLLCLELWLVSPWSSSLHTISFDIFFFRFSPFNFFCRSSLIFRSAPPSVA